MKRQLEVTRLAWETKRRIDRLLARQRSPVLAEELRQIRLAVGKMENLHNEAVAEGLGPN